ncbi:YIP1 family protein [Marinoscillum furvescens]|uniref:Yip1-like protein n=1 Tax=Marinoscillum furvescens DSM 4134 TaxID=1122208 RepID=A0A3D9L0Q9_MARFU|nr:YIP1 family protein [Marinoscillum furvescens]RED96029.1 Yip1-like protein [Marinoscillum furvescens DSM 4134]
MPSKPNPYLTIWTKPRSTFESFFYERFSQSTYGLPFIIYGISFGLNMGPEIYLLFDVNPEPQYKLLTYVLTSLVGVGATYLILGILNPWLMNLIGKIWKGEASTSELANVHSLAGIPFCLMLTYQLFLLLIRAEPTLANINAGFQYVLWIVGFRLLVIGVSVAQKFSYGMALLNILMAYLPYVIIRLSLGS